MFIDVLAFIGFVVVLGAAIGFVATVFDDSPSSTELDDDPYDEALGSVARLHAAAWSAVHDLRELADSERPR